MSGPFVRVYRTRTCGSKMCCNDDSPYPWVTLCRRCTVKIAHDYEGTWVSHFSAHAEAMDAACEHLRDKHAAS